MAKSYAERARESSYEITDRGVLIVKKAVLIYRNFSGAPDDYNKLGGTRKFSIVVTPEVAKDLIDMGWNVKEKIPTGDGAEPYWATEIIVNMKTKWPPTFTLYTDFKGKKGKREMRESEIGDLDRKIWIEKACVAINPRHHDPDPRTGSTVKGYLKQLDVLERRQEGYFGDEFADFEDDSAVSMYRAVSETDEELPFD